MVKNKLKYILAFAVVAGALVFLFTGSFSRDMVYFLEVSELPLSERAAEGRGVRVSGEVGHGNYRVDPFARTAFFELTDGQTVVNVAYEGAIPEMFEAGSTVILEGKYNPHENIFTAATLLTPCHSTYEAADFSPEDRQNHLNQVL